MYLGIYGAGLAIICQIAILKMMYDMAGIKSIGYGISSVAVMLLLLVTFYILHFRALSQGAYSSKERQGEVGKAGKAGKAALLLAAIGYTGYYIAVAVLGDIGGFTMGMAAFSVLLVLGLYMAVVFIHRYIYIQNHVEQLKAHYPVLGLPKEQRTAKHLTQLNQERTTSISQRHHKQRRGK